MKKEIKIKFVILGNNIKELREKYNLSLEELSVKSGIRKQYLQKIENGIAYGFKISHLDKLITGIMQRVVLKPCCHCV